METNTTKNNPGESDLVNSDSEPSINEQISSIINKKFNESLDQIQDDPSRLTKESFYSKFWQSTKLIIKEQLESISRGFYAAMIAIIVAILTPLIINSSLLTKLEVMNQKIEGALPTEQDKEFQNRIMEAINIQSTLNENASEIVAPQVVVQNELKKQFSETPLLLQSNVEERFEAVESGIDLLQEEVSSLKDQRVQLNQKISELNLSGFNVSTFLKRLDNLKLAGKKLKNKVSRNQHDVVELRNWLKTVYFLVGSIPLTKQSSFDNGSLLEEGMRNVIESKGDFREPLKQISETFVILDAIELLAVSGLISGRRHMSGS